MSREDGGGKLPGKTEYSGRRRSATRRSGFKAHADTSGGEFRQERVPVAELHGGHTVTVLFAIPEAAAGEWVGFGGWFWFEGDVKVSIRGAPSRVTLSEHGAGVWNKVGSLWRLDSRRSWNVEVAFRAEMPSLIALYEMDAGRVHHNHLAGARAALLTNMHIFAPEANFYADEDRAEVTSDIPEERPEGVSLTRKSCNRCARYLPINLPNHERAHLSFSNHCVAEHRRPCKHTGFGLLRGEGGRTLRLDYGFQLECRFCKKFEVNAAHNPKRTAAQMKEDGARRRALEFLLDALYEGTPQLRYRHQHGRELVDDVWERFEGTCFKCGEELASIKAMNLDHTRPLKLLWPIDGTATALCGSCNSAKRDRPPVSFYTAEELGRLSVVTGLSLPELRHPGPNVEALGRLSTRLDWFFKEFLMKEEMTIERDGKVAGELVIKALGKVIAAAGGSGWPDLDAEYDRRRLPRGHVAGTDDDDDE